MVRSSLSPAYIGVPYQATLPAAGGIRPYTYTLSGKLPKGLHFRDGRFSGVAEEKGSFDLTLDVQDAALSNREQAFTLTVSNPPPPRFGFILPPVTVKGTFTWVTNLTGRASGGFKADFQMPGLTPLLPTFRPADGVLAVWRWNADRKLLEVDAAFTRPLSGTEVFRLKLKPAKALRPLVSSRVRFFDPMHEVFAASPASLSRSYTEGKYTYPTLVLLAEHWGKHQQKTKSGKPGPPVPGDLNHDGVVNAGDLHLLRANYTWGRASQPKSRSKTGNATHSRKPSPTPAPRTPSQTSNDNLSIPPAP